MEKNNLQFLGKGVFAGILIGIAGVASLFATAQLGNEGKIIGAFLFSLGIYFIICFELKLFTGMVANIPNEKLGYAVNLALCFIANAMGVAVVACLVYFSQIGKSVSEVASGLITQKLDSSLWYINSFCSSVLCGFLITLSVKAPEYMPKKGLSATFGVVIPIMLFVFCGFDHSVANMLYFYLNFDISLKIVGYILITILGNIVGGIALPSLLKRGKQG